MPSRATLRNAGSCFVDTSQVDGAEAPPSLFPPLTLQWPDEKEGLAGDHAEVSSRTRRSCIPWCDQRPFWKAWALQWFQLNIWSQQIFRLWSQLRRWSQVKLWPWHNLW